LVVEASQVPNIDGDVVPSPQLGDQQLELLSARSVIGQRSEHEDCYWSIVTDRSRHHVHLWFFGAKRRTSEVVVGWVFVSWFVQRRVDLIAVIFGSDALRCD